MPSVKSRSIWDWGSQTTRDGGFYRGMELGEGFLMNFGRIQSAIRWHAPEGNCLGLVSEQVLGVRHRLKFNQKSAIHPRSPRPPSPFTPTDPLRPRGAPLPARTFWVFRGGDADGFGPGFVRQMSSNFLGNLCCPEPVTPKPASPVPWSSRLDLPSLPSRWRGGVNLKKNPSEHPGT